MQVDYDALSKAINNPANAAAEVFSSTDVETLFEGKVCNAFINGLNKLLYKIITESSSDELDDFQFSKWLSKKLGIIQNRFSYRIRTL